MGRATWKVTTAAAVLPLSGLTAVGAEIKIISGPATSGVLAAVAQQFERDTGHKFTSKGGVTGVLKQLIEAAYWRRVRPRAHSRASDGGVHQAGQVRSE